MVSDFWKFLRTPPALSQTAVGRSSERLNDPAALSAACVNQSCSGSFCVAVLFQVHVGSATVQPIFHLISLGFLLVLCLSVVPLHCNTQKRGAGVSYHLADRYTIVFN